MRPPTYEAVAAAAADLGSDISSFPDLDAAFAVQSGPRVLAEAIARRFTTPRGALVDDPSYGSDLRLFFNRAINNQQLAQIRNTCEREAQADQRVDAASVTVDFSASTQTLLLSIQVSSKVGQFSLTLAITDVSVTLLSVPT